ncbi:protein TolA, partial [Francisella philomiragia]
MANLNYQKIISFCKKTVDENPFLVKAILVHIGIVILLYTLAFISDLKFETSQAALSAEVQKAPK